MHPPRHDPMRIAFLLGQFPALSETFVLNQISSLLERGHSVSIFAERRSSESAEHPDVARFDLRKCTRYESMPGVTARALALPNIIAKNIGALRALNVVRFGRHAASLRLAWSTTLFDGAREFDIIQCHFGALGLKAVLLRAAGALNGKIVTAFHGEDITNYPQQFSGNIYGTLVRERRPLSPDQRALERYGLRPSAAHPAKSEFIEWVWIAAASPCRRREASPAARFVSSRSRVWSRKKGLPMRFELSRNYRFHANTSSSATDHFAAISSNWPAETGVNDKVRFVGAKPAADVIRFLHSADVLLAPSVTGSDGDIEGMPVSIMEGMASGLPVVATHHSGIPEVVADGRSGFLVDEHDVDGLARRLSDLAADPNLRARMGLAGAVLPPMNSTSPC